MALVSGRYASFKMSTAIAGARPETLTYQGSWEINIAMDTIDASYFGTAWKSQLIGMQGWTASVSGFLDVTTESSGHHSMIDSAMEARLLQNVWFHEGPTSSGPFWAPNALSTYGGQNYSTNNGCYVSNYRVSASKDGITSASFDLVGRGAIIYLMGGTSEYTILAESTTYTG